jgi:phenylalanyl-tRNA synthetase alpha chain
MEISLVKGARHIIPCVINDIRTILLSNNFTAMDAPEIDTAWNNFTVINVPETHVCRSEEQSFYLSNGQMLRTHTSNLECRALKEHTGHFSVFTIGRTYRKDEDATHTPMFHQMEILICNSKSSVEQLIQRIHWFLNQFFGQQMRIRLRPSYFPFTVPSYEVDIWYNGTWLEVMGCGILHAKIFSNLQQPMRYVMALGCGIERLAMLKYNIPDIRKLYDNDAYYVHAMAEKYRGQK